jgi:transcriptional regulator with XRE-family HTH domain
MKHPLRIARENCGATLDEVAEILGCTKVRVHRMETGESNPSDVERRVWVGAIRTLKARADKRYAEAMEA